MADGEDGGAAAAQDGNGEDGGAAAAAAAAAAEAGANAPYMPENMPEAFRGENDQQTIDKMLAGHGELTEKLAGFGTVPDDASGYDFKLSDDVTKAFNIGEDDPAIAAMREVAKEDGWTDKTAASIGKVLEKLAPKIADAHAFDEVALLQSLAPEGSAGSKEDLQAAGSKRMKEAEAIIPLLGLSDEGAAELTLLTASKAGVEALEAIKGKMAAGNVNPGGSAASDKITKESLQARVADPRNDRNNAKFDKAFAAETQRQYGEFYKG